MAEISIAILLALSFKICVNKNSIKGCSVFINKILVTGDRWQVGFPPNIFLFIIYFKNIIYYILFTVLIVILLRYIIYYPLSNNIILELLYI